MATSPFGWDNIEQESNIRDYRLDQGYTVQELSGLCETNPAQITGIQTGAISPINRNGKLHTWVEKLIKVLGVTVEQAFPRYFCKLKKDGEGFTKDQLDTMLNHPDPTRELETILHFKSLPFHRLDDNQKYVINGRFNKDMTLEEIGEELGMTRERIRQIEAKALRLLRKPYILKGY